MAKSKATAWLTEEGLQKVEGWARSGLAEKDIANNMGISLTTLKDYKKKYPTILTAIERGKDNVVEIVENVVYQQVRGYEYEEKEIVEEVDPITNEVTRRVVKTQIKKAKPSERQAQFLLRNKAPDRWNGKGTLELERLQLENEKLRQQIEEQKTSINADDIEEQRLEFKKMINETMMGYIERLEGWFSGKDER